MERISRISRGGALLIGLGLLALPALALDARAADPPSADLPTLLAVDLDPPPLFGEPAEFRVAARGGTTPVAGMVVRFGRGRSFGLSACRAGSTGLVQAPFAPGSRVRLTAPHRFRKPRARRVLVRLDGAGCGGPVRSAYRHVTVTPPAPRKKAPPPKSEEDEPFGLPDDSWELPPPAPLDGFSSRLRCPDAGRLPGRSARSQRLARRGLLCMLNAQRRKHGLGPLRENAELRRAATGHSAAMVGRGFFSHSGLNGQGLVDRVRQTAYLGRVRRWLIGENIGYGRGRGAAPRGMVRSWMRSTGHRANILNGQFSEVGLGIVRGTPGRAGGRGATYTTDFGRRG